MFNQFSKRNKQLRKCQRLSPLQKHSVNPKTYTALDNSKRIEQSVPFHDTTSIIQQSIKTLLNLREK